MKRMNVVLVGLLFSLLACSGCKTTFPETATHYAAKTKLPYRLVIEMPTDSRAQHYGEQVAGTEWESRRTDASGDNNVQQLIQDRLVREFSASGLFKEVTTNRANPGDAILKTDINVFCSQKVGFIYNRLVGMSSLRISLEKDGKVLLDKTFEKVVTDVDPQYTGSQVGFTAKNAMRSTMADSLRELISEVLRECETAATSPNNR